MEMVLKTTSRVAILGILKFGIVLSNILTPSCLFGGQVGKSPENPNPPAFASSFVKATADKSCGRASNPLPKGNETAGKGDFE